MKTVHSATIAIALGAVLLAAAVSSSIASRPAYAETATTSLSSPTLSVVSGELTLAKGELVTVQKDNQSAGSPFNIQLIRNALYLTTQANMTLTNWVSHHPGPITDPAQVAQLKTINSTATQIIHTSNAIVTLKHPGTFVQTLLGKIKANAKMIRTEVNSEL